MRKLTDPHSLTDNPPGSVLLEISCCNNICYALVNAVFSERLRDYRVREPEIIPGTK